MKGKESEENLKIQIHHPSIHSCYTYTQSPEEEGRKESATREII